MGSANHFAESYGDLIVYQKARGVARSIFEITGRFPRDERYSLVDQMRRSSRSIGAQIAEAWAKRRYPNHFASKLSDADGEKNETEHWICIAEECGYVARNEAIAVRDELTQVGRMLQRMMDRASEFKGMDYDRIKETSSLYGPEDTVLLNTEH